MICVFMLFERKRKEARDIIDPEIIYNIYGPLVKHLKMRQFLRNSKPYDSVLVNRSLAVYR